MALRVFFTFLEYAHLKWALLENGRFGMISRSTPASARRKKMRRN